MVEAAGYQVDGCTGSAWIARTSGIRFYVWATGRWQGQGDQKPYLPALPYPAFTDGVRISWEAQGLGIWVEAGPEAADALPGRSALSWLQLASRVLPQRYTTLAFMNTPAAALNACRSDAQLSRACPTRIPRVRSVKTYPRIVDGAFGIQLGGEIPGRPELMRPPHVLHIELNDDPGRWLRFDWPTAGSIAPTDGLVRSERSHAVLLGNVVWGGRPGTVVLAPAYPAGGSQGNHLLFRWRDARRSYVVGMHAWEPFTEAYATLRRIAVGLPR